MDAVKTWDFSFPFSFFSSVHFMLWFFFAWYQHYYYYYYYKGLFAVWVLSR